MDLADEQLKKGFTREEAIQSLQRAGIVDKDGKDTPPYQNLGGKSNVLARLKERSFLFRNNS